jgi:NTE family protein
MKINKNLKYALTLAGGGARGLVHIGVLCALEAAGYPPPSLIAGTSMGAIIGGLYAAGTSISELKRFVLHDLKVADFMESPGFKLNGPIGKLFVTGQFIGNFAVKPGIDPGIKVSALLERFLDGKTFQDCSIPFLCNAVDIVSGKEVVLSSGPLSKAIRASMSVPAFFEPCRIDDMCLVDGGILANMPAGAAREAGRPLGISRILAVDTHGVWNEVPAHSYHTGLNVVMRCFDVLIHAAQNNYPAPDLIVHAADQTSVFDFGRKEEMIALGEAAAAQSVRELDAFFGLGPAAYFGRKTARACGIRMEGKYAASG